VKQIGDGRKSPAFAAEEICLGFSLSVGNVLSRGGRNLGDKSGQYEICTSVSASVVVVSGFSGANDDCHDDDDDEEG